MPLHIVGWPLCAVAFAVLTAAALRVADKKGWLNR